MVDNEKRDNLANARRKVLVFSLHLTLFIGLFQLKKFRDQQQHQNGNDHLTFTPETNGTALYPVNGVIFLS